MSIAVLVDDFGFKDDDIAKFAKGFEHVDDFMEKGYLKLRHAAEVVEENTEMRFTIF
jgi:hypothetical protein